MKRKPHFVYLDVEGGDMAVNLDGILFTESPALGRLRVHWITGGFKDFTGEAVDQLVDAIVDLSVNPSNPRIEGYPDPEPSGDSPAS